jgi:hypothetical protein
MKKGNSYGYNSVEEFANENNFDIEENGSNRVGENFLTLKHQTKDIVVSFVLTGGNNNQYFYECIYSDLD